jgi:glycosyltransferase involved in cell wall biosynthesis
MKILVFMHQKGPVQRGGQVRLLQSVEPVLEREGIKYYYLFGNKCYIPPELGFAEERVFFAGRPLRRKRRLLGRLIEQFSPPPDGLVDIIEELGPDVLLGNTVTTLPHVLKLSHVLGLPNIAFAHQPEEDAARQLLLSRADNIICVSKYVKDEMDELLLRTGSNARTFLVYNAINVDEFVRETEREAFISEPIPFGRKTVIGMVARMNAQKDPCFLLRIARRIIDRYDNMHFVFVGRFGNSDYEAATLELVRKLNLQDYVTFTGYKENVSAYMARFDILAHPCAHWIEAFGMVLIEAMAHQKPIVAGRTGGIPEVVAHGETGLLCEQNDEDEFFSALSELITNRELRFSMGRQGFERVRELFDFESRAEELASIYQEIVQRVPAAV